MSIKMDDGLLASVADVIAERTGLHFPRERLNVLERGLGTAASELEFDDLESCLQWLYSSPTMTRSQIEILANHLTVGETYFFREKKGLEILEKSILPDLIRSRRDAPRLRIWSAGCCTGEEAYTIAIILAGMIPDLDRWNITLLATDINPRFLSKASAGVYGEWSFRDTPKQIQNHYFTKCKGGNFEVIAPIKKMVTFAYLNLAEDAFPSLTNNTNAMDVILCRNVLMYLAPKHIRKIARNFYRCLMENGWLLVSPSDPSHQLSPRLTFVHQSGAALYRKGPASTVEFDFLHSESSVSTTLRWTGAAVAVEPTANPDVPVAEKELPSPMSQPMPPPLAVPDEALVLYERGEYAAAADQLAAQLSNSPEDVKAMTLLARVHANQGNLGEALRLCDQAIAKQKMNPAIHYLRATVLQEQGALDEAVVSLKKTLYLDPKFALAHFTLGTVALQFGRFEVSDKHFENAKALLASCSPDEILPESGGITAARLTEIISRTMSRRVLQ